MAGFLNLGVLRKYLENPQKTWNNYLGTHALWESILKISKNKPKKPNKSLIQVMADLAEFYLILLKTKFK